MNPYDNLAAHRMLDANLNRAMEALRTLEDIARFQDHSVIQQKYKLLRHQLQSAAALWDNALLLASRDAANDVGRETKTSSETSRTGGLVEIAQAASQRAQQALRCLEEVAKFVYPDSASRVESVRYQAYDLNAQLLLAQKRDLAFLQRARLYVLADCQLSLDAFSSRVSEVSRAGADIIQIRDKQRDARELIQYTEAAIKAVDSTKTRIVVNDRADVLQCSQAWGLHVGQSDLSLAQARPIVRPHCVVGVSTHDVAQVTEAIDSGADYIGCGPTFPSNTKSFESFPGLDFLRSVAKLLEDRDTMLPAFAIGGIDLANVESLLSTGIRRVAVSSAIWKADSPGIAAESFCQKLAKY